MKELSKKNLFFVGLMLFCMFFGAGNLIFPPFLGQQSGKYVVIAFSGFIISAVGLPVLAVVIVAKSKGLNALASHVHPVFAIVFTILIYLSIGPFLGIPRTGSLAYQMALAPFLSKRAGVSPLPLFLYTLVYFGIAFWLSLNPTKLVDRLGKVLTPILLILIAGVFVCSLIKPIGSFAAPKGDYALFPFFKGFSEGYMTMDAIAALNFGIVIASTLKLMGIKNEKSLISYSSKAGLIAGAFLIIIYAMLAYVGASSRGISLNAQNGGEILTAVSNFLFGDYGAVILGIIFSLACLTTAVGLVTSCSEYFATLTTKIKYKTWVFILSASSLIFSNVGLTKILSISVPILNAIYPMAIILMIMFLLNNLFNGSKYVYALGMLFTSVFSIIDSLNGAVLKIASITNTFNYIPLYSKGMGWIVPAAFGMIVGYIVSLSRQKMTVQNEA
ncbi:MULTISPECIES: branched-chain amino acid transport system II carrier protein [Clostridium]|uniref:branched-chain amino acid transport system II carrier protein n=1 Tax=Clostridium TaxID=1485 RepID=UPI00069DB8A3|nr:MULTISPECIES: branched-chain amino acid transport system II carrier protein [Clostridium]KOF56672.1 branched-chain amino acid transporter [Clostridium sp. DMHC 10]MCD2346702.1 branched-chain amino acid transport system II carrier protein [Clostridium guangxiense]